MNIAMRKEFLKAKKVLHPNSRKSIAIAKRAKKISSRDKAKVSGLIKQNLIGEKMMWMKENMVPDICPYTPELTAQLLERYIARHNEEMEQINIKRSIGGKRSRQHASREDVIRMTKERELEEYNTCGIEIPDILNATQCELVRNWNGELRYITNFKFRRFGRRHLNEHLERLEKKAKESTEKPPAKEMENIGENNTETLNAKESLNETADSAEDIQRSHDTMEVE